MQYYKPYRSLRLSLSPGTREHHDLRGVERPLKIGEECRKGCICCRAKLGTGILHKRRHSQALVANILKLSGFPCSLILPLCSVPSLPYLFKFLPPHCGRQPVAEATTRTGECPTIPYLWFYGVAPSSHQLP